MKQRRIRYVISGQGEKCNKCKQVMERRGHKERPMKTFYYRKWDFCRNCNHVQHYDEFKSESWKEAERQDFIFNDL